ncbi:MAG: hypothetical protein EOP32_24020 [Rhodococcus sp. (in: high G+C Gram-positive bacteria)]|nr:MAG: hypothetical protein EOP32_24020 [Rhodococcus sp. (in: high G+C Gram-positive bacteria)]
MATRFFRFNLENALPGSTLRLESQSLCGGCWTPQWEPPATIRSGAKAGWQSEACGFMTGTQGWVKYRIIGSDDGVGANEGLIYLYWTNPFMGLTDFKHVLRAKDEEADCNAEDSAGSQFSELPAADISSIEFGSTSVYLGGNPVVLFTPPWESIFPGSSWASVGMMGISERAEVSTIIQRKATPVVPAFAEPPKTTQRLVETDPAPQYFVGKWLAASLTVSIALTGFKQFRIRISDHTQPEPLEVDVTASLGVSGAVASVVKDVDYVSVLANGSGRRAQLLKSAVAVSGVAHIARELSGETPGGPMWAKDVTGPRYRHLVASTNDNRITKSAIREHSLINDMNVTESVTEIIDAVDERINARDYIIHVGQGIALWLIQIKEDGRTVDYQLHYQRVALEKGVVLVDENLIFDLGVR